MNFIRIGDKVISRKKIDKEIDEIIKLRALGLSQSDVGEKMNIERTFISRLEGLGEIRKGQSIAAVGFPIKNKQEVEKVLREYGVEYSFLMSEEERNNFVNQSNGQQLINYLMELINKFRGFDTVIVMASDYRNKIIKDMLDNQIIEIDIGKSPLKDDVIVNLELLTEILKILKG
ncbi:MAG: family transcriptional regulator [Clostridia bacterium]|jgi:transcriptional regulator with XRE-family HTH domain|nr:family transcriptional regulator [Clostridia bacterium]